EVEWNVNFILVALVRSHRLGGTLTISAIALACRLTCEGAGKRREPSLAVFAPRSAGQALQEKEQVLDEFCCIGRRQVTAHHQAGDACKRQPDDRTTVTDTLEKVVAEERADHTAKTMGQMRRA